MRILLQALSKKKKNVKANSLEILEIVKGEEKTRKVSKVFKASEGFACCSCVVSCGCE